MVRRLTAMVLLCLGLMSCAWAEEGEQPFVNPTRDPNASEYSTETPENLLPEHLVAHSYIVMERSTGDVLMERNADQAMFPASTTKIMTAYIALQLGNLDDVIEISETALDMGGDEAASMVPFDLHEQVTLRDAIYGMMLPSGNEAANAVAEYVSGSIGAFTDLMNEVAQMLGCSSSTHFNNPNGLHDDLHISTARDLAIIMDAALDNETFREIIGTQAYALSSTEHNPSRTIYNSNNLIREDNDYYYEKCIGGKTGFTSNAGYVLVEAAEENGVELIAVVMYSGYYSRWADARRLLEYGFTLYESITPEEIYAQDPTKLQISGFDPEQVTRFENSGLSDEKLREIRLGELWLDIQPIDPDQKAAITGRKEDVEFLTADVSSFTSIEWVSEARAPITIGQVMGIMTFYLQNGETAQYELIATRSVDARQDAPPTLEEIEERVQADDSLFPPFSWDWALPPILAAVAVLLTLRAVIKLLLRRRRAHRKKIPKPKRRYYS